MSRIRQFIISLFSCGSSRGAEVVLKAPDDLVVQRELVVKPDELVVKEKPVVKSKVKQNHVFKPFQYSYSVKDFKPSGKEYATEEKDGIVHVNVRSDAERKLFLKDAKDQKVEVQERVYDKFVSGKTQIGEVTVTFDTLRVYINELVESQEVTKDLKRSFAITHSGEGFKVSTTSYEVSKLLTADGKFKPFKRNNKAKKLAPKVVENEDKAV